MEYVPVRIIAAFENMTEDEIIEGYYDGLKNEPEPKGNRSQSYWHGWRNGMVDGRHAKPDEAQRDLARDAIQKGYFR